MKEDTGKHYRFSYKGIKLDPARICLIYGVSNPLQCAIIKKSLCTGKRGKKNLVDDIKDIICAAERWLEMIEEDSDEKLSDKENKLIKEIKEKMLLESLDLDNIIISRFGESGIIATCKKTSVSGFCNLANKDHVNKNAAMINLAINLKKYKGERI